MRQTLRGTRQGKRGLGCLEQPAPEGLRVWSWTPRLWSPPLSGLLLRGCWVATVALAKGL